MHKTFLMFIGDKIQSNIGVQWWFLFYRLFARLPAFIHSFIHLFFGSRPHSPRATFNQATRLTKQPNHESRYRQTQRMDKLLLAFANL